MFLLVTMTTGPEHVWRAGSAAPTDIGADAAQHQHPQHTGQTDQHRQQNRSRFFITFGQSLFLMETCKETWKHFESRGVFFACMSSGIPGLPGRDGFPGSKGDPGEKGMKGEST